MDQRTQFVADFLRHSLSISELCELYCVSRKTGYKWIDRYLQQGPAGLQERSRRPHASPNATPAHVTAAFIELRTHHPSWGAKKLLSVLERRHPHWDLPGRSTVCDILSRNGLVPKQRRRRAIGHPGAPTTALLVPNVVWSADYKGQFKTGDGRYCYPLTVTDNCSRFLLGCQALTSTAVHEAKPVFTRLFKQYGLPLRIRTDNGVPFATNTLARLSRLSAWWVRPGILPEFIEPGKPQQNGRHERMHRTLKAETTRPPAGSCRAQQHKFNRFRLEFNDERPHEALDMQTPAACYAPSPRPMPDKLPPLHYPDRFEVRYVSANGGIRWNKHWVNVSTTCVGEYVGLEEIDDGVWNVYFGPLKLGRLLERHMRIEDAFGRLKRHG
ncbi:transposase [Betaproteobacteria bacterium PRO7]|jgi:transposase InsO family protein|nr:transposase [Betaproteobacteria bacterium PRO7]